MSVPQRKRSRLAAQRSDRLTFCLSAAIAFHLGMLTAVAGLWQPLEPSEPASETLLEAAAPIDFVYLEPPEQPVEVEPETEQQSTVDSVAAGDRHPDLPTNSGKPEQGDAIAVKPSEPLEKPTPPPPPTAGRITPISSIPSATDHTQNKGLTSALPLKPEASPTAEPPVGQSLDQSLPAAQPAPRPEVSATQLPLLASETADLSVAVESAVETSEPHPPKPESFSSEAADQATLPPPPSQSPLLEQPPAAITQPSQQTPAPEASPELLGGQGLEGLPNPDHNAPGTPAIAAHDDEMWGDYMAALSQEINQNWQRIELDIPREAKVRFSINSSGGLVNLELSLSSGSDMADQAALDAVTASAPFAPFPEQVTKELLTINFTFTYHILDPARSL